MSRNPVLWLACRERWQSITIWVATMLVLALVGTLLIVSLVWEASFMLWMMWGYFGGALALAFYLGTASQASRFFVEARRSGLMELLLAAPLNGKEIVQGQWRALLRMFAAPLMIYLSVHFVASALSQRAGAVSMWGGVPTLTQVVAVAVAGTLVTAANLVALCWFGMWMGMTSRSANLATLKSLVFVQVIPFFVIYFGSTMGLGLLIPLMTAGVTPSVPFGSWYSFLFTLVPLGLTLAKDVLFFEMARRKLYAQFRELAVRALVPLHSTGPPPVIAARP